MLRYTGVEIKLKHLLKKKTLNPYWDESYSISSRDPWEDIKLTCFDHDRFTRDEVLGGATVSTRGLQNGVERPVTVQLVPRGELCIRLTALDFPPDYSNQQQQPPVQYQQTTYNYTTQAMPPQTQPVNYAPMTGGFQAPPMTGYSPQPMMNTGYSSPPMTGSFNQQTVVTQPMMNTGYPSQPMMNTGYPPQPMTGYPTGGYQMTGGFAPQPVITQTEYTQTMTAYPSSGYQSGGFNMYAPMGGQVGSNNYNTGLQAPGGGYPAGGYGLKPPGY